MREYLERTLFYLYDEEQISLQQAKFENCRFGAFVDKKKKPEFISINSRF